MRRRPYVITRYTLARARRLGVTVRPSTRPGKKLDVYDRGGRFLAAIGARGYGDFPTFWRERGRDFAMRRRRAYKARHARDRVRPWTRGWLADQLLW